ncbi:MAG: ArsR/SmtB family transcription factor [Alphaproteobacteria bacterium]
MKNSVVKLGAKLFKALGNEKRLEILFNLLNKELNVGELEKLVDLSQSALSQHLAVLRGGDIVKTRRVAQTIFYSIKSEKVIKALNFIKKLYNTPCY